MNSLTDFDSPLSRLITYLFPLNCFEELLVKYNFLDPDCSKVVLSRFLGLGIIVGSVLVKLPQIIKIWNARSGVGVSLFSQSLELLCLTATAAYSFSNGFHFSAWGEALFIAVQTLMIALLILLYSNRKLGAAAYLSVYGCCAFICSQKLLPLSTLSMLQFLNVPIVFIARGIQIAENYRSRSTGQLSLITTFLMFAGGLARIFTSYQETGDKLFIFTFVVATSMNAILLAQILFYWSAPSKKKFA